MTDPQSTPQPPQGESPQASATPENTLPESNPPSPEAQSPETAGQSQGNASQGALSEDRVREELKQVVDPELFVNVVDLGLIYQVDLQPAEDEADKTDISIEMTLTSPACPAGPHLIQQCKNVLGRLESVRDVNVRLVMDPPWTPDRMTEDAKDQLGIF